MNFFELSFLFFAFLGLLLALSFFIKKNGDRQSNTILGIYLLLFAYNIVFNTLYWSELLYRKTYIHFFYTNFFPWISYGPLFYLYVKRVVLKKDFKTVELLHFLPVLLFVIARWPLFSLDAELKLAAALDGSWRNYGFMIRHVSWFFIIPQMLVYALSALVILRKNTTLLDSNKRLWLKFFIGSFLGYWLAFTSYFVLSYSGLITKQNDYFIGYLIVFFIGMVAYFGFMQPDVFNGLSMEKVIPFIKYKKTGLTQSHSLELKDRLLMIMEKEKPFLENDLRLEDLAKSLSLSRHHMSQVINEHFQMSFFDYINQHRIEEAKELLIKNREDLNISQIAYSVGFNNRVSFYKAFKKFTGTTPSDYISVHSHHAS
ncbi:helix-turn-helix domain-containing protein [Leptobacterium flavescens]|uniref:Helix-turn-helix domain-containing protein n=1 Tax=Leptobacterium flavescens TaxID=472055 RepID=A0A6P0US12_9FLAO|nr:helix-turn-helix domain-containing protein [Leptobacterium flavescens]NER13166.1 helix-turn-helix domain-containing protein [Leptobacterium flavescens]